MYILEFKDRPGTPLYHCEHFIEGHYIKYNSNSGFVDCSLRNTPQVFVPCKQNLQFSTLIILLTNPKFQIDLSRFLKTLGKGGGTSN